jgi:NDP-sugar pyrophosphorylase family protein
MGNTLLVLAAGLGSRYGKTKQIESVGEHGELLIDYSVFDAVRAGFTKFVFVIRREIEAEFRAKFFDRICRRINATYVFQETPGWREKPMGTTAALLSAAAVINEPFCVVSADDYYGPHAFEKIQAFFAQEPKDCAAVAFKLENTMSDFGTVSRGILETDRENIVTGFRERIALRRGEDIDFLTAGVFSTAPQNTRVAMSFYALRPNVFEHLREIYNEFLKNLNNDPARECPLSDNLGQLIREGKIKMRALDTMEHWAGFTYPADKAAVEKTLAEHTKNGNYPSPLWQF